MAAISWTEPTKRGDKHIDFRVVYALMIEDQSGRLGRSGANCCQRQVEPCRQPLQSCRVWKSAGSCVRGQVMDGRPRQPSHPSDIRVRTLQLRHSLVNESLQCVHEFTSPVFSLTIIVLG